MVGLIVIAHAPLASALHGCAKHVYGRAPEQCAVLDVLPDADPAASIAQAGASVAAVDTGDGVLVLVDLFGASPGNIAARLALPGRVEVVSGVNLPMLLRVLCYRNTTPLSGLPDKAVGGGGSGIFRITQERTTAPQHQRPFPPDPNQTGAAPDGDPRLQDQQ